MRLSQLLSNKNIKNDTLVRALCLDSREAIQDSLFFAYPGERSDGRAYIEAAIAQGATTIVYENSDGFSPNTSQFPAVTFIGQPKLKWQVGEIAARFYQEPSQNMNLICVTGTNGKTSITHFIAQALGKNNLACAVMGTVGNGLLANLSNSTHTTLCPIDFQRTLAEFQQQHITHVALEVSSHALDQGRVNGTEFTTAVYTQLSRDHLDYHGDMQSYAKAKELLFQQPNLKNAVINQDDEFGLELINRYQKKLSVLTYSVRELAHLRAREFRVTDEGFRVNLETEWGDAELNCALFGEFNVSNVLATLGVLLINDIPFDRAVASCHELQSVAGRMQTFKNPDRPTVVVDYAHTPDALLKALSTLRLHCQGKLWCVFGCGGNRDKGKRPLMAEVAERLADRVIVTNDNPRLESPSEIVEDIRRGLKSAAACEVVLDRAAAIRKAVQNASSNDIVLVAGKGHETYQIIGDQILPFSDAKEVLSALNSEG